MIGVPELAGIDLGVAGSALAFGFQEEIEACLC